VALAGFVVTVGLGAVRAVEELSRVSDLIATAYGGVLTAKILVLLR